MTFDERRLHETQDETQRHAEHERIQQAAQNRIRDRIEHAGRTS